MECGNRKKSDVIVSMNRNGTGQNNIKIESKYGVMFDKHILSTVEKFLLENRLTGCDISIEDWGSWEYALVARLEACAAGMCDENDAG